MTSTDGGFLDGILSSVLGGSNTLGALLGPSDTPSPSEPLSTPHPTPTPGTDGSGGLLGSVASGVVGGARTVAGKVVSGVQPALL